MGRVSAALTLLALVAACSKGPAGPSPPSSGDGGQDEAAGRHSGLQDADVAKAAIHYVGRFDTRDPTGPRFGWPGTAVVATFTGSGMTALLHDTGRNYFVVAVDGRKPTAIESATGTHTYTLASGLAPGEHTLTLTKRTESLFGTVQLVELRPEGGSFVPTPSPFSRRIELVGDSITCGAGINGTCDAGPTCCPTTAAMEDETIAYGALAAQALDAQQTAIAYSGIGMVRNGDRSTTGLMPTRFMLALPDDSSSLWSFSTSPPDVVVINLGTNDFWTGDPGSNFVAAYELFITKDIRPHYPDAHVLCALSAMLTDPLRSAARTDLKRVVSDLTAAGDSRVSYFEFDEQNASDGIGCNRHPDATTQRKDASALVTAIRGVTGW